MQADIPNFVHLRSHSEFSVVDGTIRIKQLIKRAAELQQPVVALTDLSNMFGFVKFYKAARGAGIKPIAGCDFWIEDLDGSGDLSRCLLLARNNDGYLQLCSLISKAWIENTQITKAVLKPEWLQDAKDLIMLSGGAHGDIAQAFAKGKPDKARKIAEHWRCCFPDAFYLELNRSGHKDEEQYNQAALTLAHELGLPVVAAHPVQFLNESDYEPHRARVCIAAGETFSHPVAASEFTDEQYLLSSAEMVGRFADIPSAIANTVEIAKRCNVTLTLGKPQLPLYPTPDGMTLDDYLRSLAQEGLVKRMEMLYPDQKQREAKMPEYQERLEKECEVIISMGFPGYFLIVQDFINWAKNNGVPVGPGRGSGAGSLVAYALGITDLDPLQYDLLFERFLNPERVSMPDFDVDFCQDNRDRVIDYVKRTYGHQAVSQIATFGTLGAKAVVRDVGRVLEMPYSLCDGLSKLIPFNPASPWTLTDALEKEPAFRQRYDNEEEVQEIVDTSLPLEGLTRSVGMHAGGVLIAPGKLTDFCPLYCQPGSENVVSQYDKNDVEDVGLVKFDFLGLRNLTILDWALRYLRRLNKGYEDFDLLTLPLDDSDTFKLFCSANTTAVFQLESRGMKELLKKLQPNTFEDIIAVLALFRPGPLDSGMVDDFVNRKHGRAEVDYFHPDLESTLQSTYGVIVYQEQVMLISQIIGGYSLGGADLLRRAMGKKKPEEMAKHRVIFEKGALKKGYDGQMAKNLFDLMEKFAGYGFNKSHSAAYALIAYQTAWLKSHFPAEFLAATLSSDMDDTDKVQTFYLDCLANGLAMLPPDINQSGYRFEPIEDEHTRAGKTSRSIRYGLGAVKGVGQSAVESIMQEREQGGPFKNLFDFASRVDHHLVGGRTVEALIRAGAFDSINTNRAALLASVGDAYEAAKQKASMQNQSLLFADETDDVIEHQMQNVSDWSLHEALIEEKKALGFYYSHHLFDVWRDEVRRFVPTRLDAIQEHSSLQWIAGVLVSTRFFALKNNGGDDKIAFLLLDDGSAQVEVMCPSDTFEQYRHLLKSDELILVRAKVRQNRGNGNIRITAEQIYDLQSAREAMAKHLVVNVSRGMEIAQLRRLLNPFRAEPENNRPGVRCRLNYEACDEWRCDIDLGEEWRLRLDPALLQNLSTHPDIGGYEVNY